MGYVVFSTLRDPRMTIALGNLLININGLLRGYNLLLNSRVHQSRPRKALLAVPQKKGLGYGGSRYYQPVSVWVTSGNSGSTAPSQPFLKRV